MPDSHASDNGEEESFETSLIDILPLTVHNYSVQRQVREEAKRKFIEFLEKKDLRITNQRRVIIDTVFDTDEHFTVDQLLDWAREKDSSVSRATVYRTLPLLTESNLSPRDGFRETVQVLRS